jgi:hypothetical protein
MDKPDPVPDEALVSCEICLTQVPASEAQSAEAADYVANFCGVECYQKWREQQKSAKQDPVSGPGQ